MLTVLCSVAISNRTLYVYGIILEPCNVMSSIPLSHFQKKSQPRLRVRRRAWANYRVRSRGGAVELKFCFYQYCISSARSKGNLYEYCIILEPYNVMSSMPPFTFPQKTFNLGVGSGLGFGLSIGLGPGVGQCN